MSGVFRAELRLVDQNAKLVQNVLCLWMRNGMDAQTIGIIVAVAGVGVAIIGIFVPLMIMLLRRVDRLTQVVTALVNHRHGADGLPTYNVLPD